MRHDCRQCIRKAQESGVVIEEANDLSFADEHYAQLKHVFALKNSVPPFGVDRIRKLIELVHPSGNLLMLRARNKDGICIATSILPESPRRDSRLRHSGGGRNPVFSIRSGPRAFAGVTDTEIMHQGFHVPL